MNEQNLLDEIDFNTFTIILKHLLLTKITELLICLLFGQLYDFRKKIVNPL